MRKRDLKGTINMQETYTIYFQKLCISKISTLSEKYES